MSDIFNLKVTQPSIRILLADDHTLFRQGIQTLLASELDVNVIGYAKNGGEAEIADALRCIVPAR